MLEGIYDFKALKLLGCIIFIIFKVFCKYIMV